jgi:hypothetical protein
MIDASANAAANGRHQHERTIEIPGGRPAHSPCKLHQIDDIERIVAKLNLCDRALSGERKSNRGAHDSSFVEGRIPCGPQALRLREDATERRSDVLAEDIGDAEPRLAHVKGEPYGLNDGSH